MDNHKSVKIVKDDEKAPVFNKVTNYAVFESCNRFKSTQREKYFKKKDKKLNFKRDKFVSEVRLLNKVDRGVYLSSNDSFDSLIDNPYMPYEPPVLNYLGKYNNLNNEISSIQKSS